jgi:hypothetical protein
MVKLGYLGDNPFTHATLRPYDLKKVVLEGEYNENGKFIATSIAEDVADVAPTQE